MACDALVVLLVLWLAGCGVREPSKLSLPACPSLPEYTPDQQVQAADELAAMPDGGIVKGLFMPDYGRMRDGVRACRSGTTP
jgi:hypothetical protein